jgi:hypothetical protein
LEGCDKFSTKEEPMQRIIVYLLLIAFSLPTMVNAEPPIPIDINERISFPGECYGRSDTPHLSRHVAGTVNVLARTYCPKTGVSITSRLVRTYQGIEVEKTASKNGIGLVTLSISMKCIWKKGNPEIKYRIYSKHRLSNGSSGETEQEASLRC